MVKRREIFDDVACDQQDVIREYFGSTRGRQLLLSISEREDILKTYRSILYAIIQIC